jgi:hypothetical protein
MDASKEDAKMATKNGKTGQDEKISTPFWFTVTIILLVVAGLACLIVAPFVAAKLTMIFFAAMFWLATAAVAALFENGWMDTSMPFCFMGAIIALAGAGLACLIVAPFVAAKLTMIFFAAMFWLATAAVAALFENGWVDTDGTNPPYMLARLHFGHYVKSGGKIRLEEELGKRFFFLYGFMSTFKLFDMSQHQASVTINDVKTVGKTKGETEKTTVAVTQSTGNTVEVLYVYEINPNLVDKFILAAGEIDGEKTEGKHFAAIEKRINAAISATLNEICGNPNVELINGWEDLTAKRDALAREIARVLKGEIEAKDARENVEEEEIREGEEKKTHFSIAEQLGITIVRVFIADVKPDHDLEERQEQISLANKQAEVNAAMAKAQKTRVEAYTDGIHEFVEAGLSPADAASLYGALNGEVPATTVFVRGGNGENMAAAAILASRKRGDE